MLQQGQTLRRKEAVMTSDINNVESSDGESDSGEQMIHESTSRKTTLEDMEGSFSEEEDEGMEPVVHPEPEDNDEVVKSVLDSNQSGSRKHRKENPPQINPSEYLVIESAGRKDDGEAKVALAFAGDDDVVAEFAAEKKRVIGEERPKDIDLRLPGWGEWSGPGIKQSQRRKKRSVIADYFCGVV